MKLSVIIPILNEADNLQKLFTWLDIKNSSSEFIVVDCFRSVDNSEEICRNYGVNYLRSDNSGRAVQMNEGAKIATGKILMFLHADVIPAKNFEKLIEDATAAGNKVGFFAYHFHPTNRWLDINARLTKKDGLFAGGGDQCQFFLKETFHSLGGYDESLHLMEDFALIRKVKKLKIPYTIIEEPALVSSRKYNNNSYLWVNFINLLVFTGFLLGVSSPKLRQVYAKALDK